MPQPQYCLTDKTSHRQPASSPDVSQADHWAHLATVNQRLQVACQKIAHTNGTHAAVGIELFEGSPSVEVALSPVGIMRWRCRPVNQVQINVIEPQAFERRVEGTQRVVVTRLGGPHFCCYPQLAAVDAAGGIRFRWPFSPIQLPRRRRQWPKCQTLWQAFQCHCSV